jgi:hypothetical protein
MDLAKLSNGPREPEADVLEAVNWVDPESNRRAEVPGKVACKRAPASYAVAAAAPNRTVVRRRIVIVVPRILDPF